MSIFRCNQRKQMISINSIKTYVDVMKKKSTEKKVNENKIAMKNFEMIAVGIENAKVKMLT